MDTKTAISLGKALRIADNAIEYISELLEYVGETEPDDDPIYFELKKSLKKLEIEIYEKK